MDVAMELSRIVITEHGEQQVIFLREKGGQRTFPIVIGSVEALAIDRRLKGVELPRPMTHDLLASVIESMGGQVDRIVVSDLRHHTFIATLYIRRDGEMIEVDSRPSDAIALGIASDTPIFVAEHVLNAVLSEPVSTTEDRLNFLRQRMAMLEAKIAELGSRLENEAFLANAPDEIISEHRRSLEELQSEYDAIERVLKKLG